MNGISWYRLKSFDFGEIHNSSHDWLWLNLPLELLSKSVWGVFRENFIHVIFLQLPLVTQSEQGVQPARAQGQDVSVHPASTPTRFGFAAKLRSLTMTQTKGSGTFRLLAAVHHREPVIEAAWSGRWQVGELSTQPLSHTAVTACLTRRTSWRAD